MEWKGVMPPEHCASILDTVSSKIKAIETSTNQKLKELLTGFSSSLQEMLEGAKISDLPNLLKKLEKLKCDCEALQADANRQQEVELAALKAQLDWISQQGADRESDELPSDVDQGVSQTEREADQDPQAVDQEVFQTELGKERINLAKKFVDDNRLDPEIKSRLDQIKYTDNYIDIGGIKRNLRKYNNWQTATKGNFEHSFAWIFGTSLPLQQTNSEGVSEYPWDPKIAIIPIILNLKKNWRVGQDGKRHGEGKSWFYHLGGTRVLKFDETGGVVREKREADWDLYPLMVMS